MYKITCDIFKDTHSEKAHSNKIPVCTKSIDMELCVVGT